MGEVEAPDIDYADDDTFAPFVEYLQRVVAHAARSRRRTAVTHDLGTVECEWLGRMDERDIGIALELLER